MKNGTNKLLKTYYFIIDQILNRTSTNKSEDKNKLNTIFKAWYTDKKSIDYTSLKDFEKEDLHSLINLILIEFAVEYGIYLRQPDDPMNAENISLSEYLEYKYWNMNQLDNLIEGYKNIPDDFELITSLDQLKSRPNTKSNKLKNRLLLYVYSPITDLFYKKYTSNFTPIDKLENYINKQLVYGQTTTKP